MPDEKTLSCQLDHTFGTRGRAHHTWVDSYLNGRSCNSSSVSCNYVCDWASVVHRLHLTDRQHHRRLQKSSPCPVRRWHLTIHHIQHWQGPRRYQRLFPVNAPLVGRQRALSELKQIWGDRHWYQCKTKIRTTNRRCHSHRRYCFCYKNSKEPWRYHTKHAALQCSMLITYDRQLIFTFGFYIICRWVSVNDAKTVTTAMVSSGLDYCNSILTIWNLSNLIKLQHIQTALACIVMMTNRREHITPVLAELHWLPVTTRIHFKITLITFTIPSLTKLATSTTYTPAVQAVLATDVCQP